MIAIPALELRQGRAVRPRSDGGGSDATDADPLATVRAWANFGFRRIHLMDLDAEFGTGSNEFVVDDIVRDGSIDVQVAGGVQSADTIEQVVEAGACSVVLGSRALDEQDWLANVVELFPGTLIVYAEVRDRRVHTRGMMRNLPLDLLDLVEELSELRLGGLLLANEPEASRNSWDLSLLEDVAEAIAAPVTVMGGVHSMSDLRAFEHRGVAGVVLGAPLYAGILDAHTLVQEYGA